MKGIIHMRLSIAFVTRLYNHTRANGLESDPCGLLLIITAILISHIQHVHGKVVHVHRHLILHRPHLYLCSLITYLCTCHIRGKLDLLVLFVISITHMIITHLARSFERKIFSYQLYGAANEHFL